jgi:hypothetical protein
VSAVASKIQAGNLYCSLEISGTLWLARFSRLSRYGPCRAKNHPSVSCAIRLAKTSRSYFAVLHLPDKRWIDVHTFAMEVRRLPIG